MNNGIGKYGLMPLVLLLSLLMLSSGIQYAGATTLTANGLLYTNLDVGQSYIMSANVYGGAAPYTANWVWSNSILGITFSTPSQPIPTIAGYYTASLNVTPQFPGAIVNTYNNIQYGTPVPPPNSIIGNWIVTSFITDSGGNVISISNTLHVFKPIAPTLPIATTNIIAAGLSTTLTETQTGGSGSFSYNWYFSFNNGAFGPVTGNPTFSASGGVLTINSNSATTPGTYTIMPQVSDTGTSAPFVVPGPPAVIRVVPGEVGCYNSANIILSPCSIPFINVVPALEPTQSAATPAISIANSLPVPGPFNVVITWNSLGSTDYFMGSTTNTLVIPDFSNDIYPSITLVSSNSIGIDIEGHPFMFANAPNPSNNVFGTFAFNIIVTDSGTNPSNVAFAVNTLTLSPAFGLAFAPTVNGSFSFGNVVTLSANGVSGAAPFTFSFQLFNALTNAQFIPPGPAMPGFMDSNPGFVMSSSRTPPMPPGGYYIKFKVTDATGASGTTGKSNNFEVPGMVFFNSSSGNSIVMGNFVFYNRPEILNFPNSGAKFNFSLTNNTIFTGNIFIANASATVAHIGFPSGQYQSFASTNVILPNNYTLQASVTLSYPCSQQWWTIVPYELPSNGVWLPVTAYTQNINACTFTFNAPKDPVISLMSNQNPNPTTTTGGGGGGGSGSSTSTSSSSTTSSTTSTVATTTISVNSTVPANQTSSNSSINIAGGASGTINFGNSNTIIKIGNNGSANAAANVLITNFTRYITVLPPAGYHGLESAINLSISTASNVLITVTMHYNCSDPAYSVAPFELLNGSWVAVQPFSTDATTCTVDFTAQKDPVYAVFSSYTTTTVPPTTTVNTTTALPQPQPASQSSSLWIAGVAVIVVIIAVGYVLIRRKR